jgi:hypothetical protein
VSPRFPALNENHERLIHDTVTAAAAAAAEEEEDMVETVEAVEAAATAEMAAVEVESEMVARAAEC